MSGLSAVSNTQFNLTRTLLETRWTTFAAVLSRPPITASVRATGAFDPRKTPGFPSFSTAGYGFGRVCKRPFPYGLRYCTVRVRNLWRSPMSAIGYARVSTEDQQTDSQLTELRAAGCATIFQEKASGGSRNRIELSRCLERIGPGDTLVVVRIDRLARSLSHLLEVIERLRDRGAHFRSLHDPIDTSSPQGVFTLQVLGAAAEFERALIRERTKAGLRAAKARGRIGGNPKLKAKDPAATRAVATARSEAYFTKVNQEANEWLPTVRRLRPDKPWDEVVRAVNARLPAARRPWTRDRLIRAVRRLVKEKAADPTLLSPAPRKRSPDRLVVLVAGIARNAPQLTIREIGAELERLRAKTRRGGSRWSPSSVAHLLQRARKAGLLEDAKQALTGSIQTRQHVNL